MSTLQPDIDASITWWFYYYIFCNVVNVISIAVIIVGPLFSAWGVAPRVWAIASALGGVALAYFGLSGVSTNFITARNDLKVAKYHYYADNDRDKLIAAYEDAMNRASWAPPALRGSQPLEPSTAQPNQKIPVALGAARFLEPEKVSDWPIATEIHFTRHVGDQGKSGLVVLKVSFVAE